MQYFDKTRAVNRSRVIEYVNFLKNILINLQFILALSNFVQQVKKNSTWKPINTQKDIQLKKYKSIIVYFYKCNSMKINYCAKFKRLWCNADTIYPMLQKMSDYFFKEISHFPASWILRKLLLNIWIDHSIWRELEKKGSMSLFSDQLNYFYSFIILVLNQFSRDRIWISKQNRWHPCEFICFGCN